MNTRSAVLDGKCMRALYDHGVTREQIEAFVTHAESGREQSSEGIARLILPGFRNLEREVVAQSR